MPVTLNPGVMKRRNSDGTYTDLAPGIITTVDSALSASSTSPVQNKVITAKIGTDTLQTTAQTLVGALNEHETDISKILEIAGNYNNAGFHNSIYRGKNLGTSVTAAQWTAISSGAFTDLFIGDYWVINSVNWRIAAFDYWLNCGDTACNTHHIVIVPDSCLYNAQMHNTDDGKYQAGAANTTEGAYVGSDMYTTNLETAKTRIDAAFGAAHILSHRSYLKNAVTNGYESSGAWYDSTVELMTEQNVYGCKVFGNCVNGTNFPTSYTIDKTQFPLFALEPSRICNRAGWWLRDVASAAFFAVVGAAGDCRAHNASRPFGVRPAFGIKA